MSAPLRERLVEIALALEMGWPLPDRANEAIREARDLIDGEILGAICDAEEEEDLAVQRIDMARNRRAAATSVGRQIAWRI